MPDLLLCTAVPPGLQAAHARLLTGAGLRLEEAGECTALLLADDGALLACGTRSGKVLRQIAVLPEAEGGGACAEVVSALLQDATAHGVPHPLLFTAPGKSGLFRSLGFTPLAQTADMLMMEHGRGGLRRFLSGIPVGPERPVGSIVCHANPFTLGHRHLIAYAAARCAQVLVFVLSDTDSLFPPELRLRLVREGTADLPNVRAYPGGDYLISPATFPAYFLKDQARAPEAKCDLDLTLFGSAIAPALHITERFVGQEPTCAVTAQYNRRMQAILPAYGIHVTEIPRLNALAGAHTDAERLLGNRLVGENLDPDLAATLGVTGHGDTGRLDLVAGDPAGLHGLDAELTVGNLIAAGGSALHTAALNLAELCSLGH